MHKFAFLGLLLAAPALAQPTDTETTETEEAGDEAVVEKEQEKTPEPEEKPAASVTYDKGFTFKSGDDAFELRLANRFQFRFETARPLEGDDAEFASRFVTARARLTLEGHAFSEDNTFKVEFSYSDQGFTSLRDYYVNRKFGGVQLRAGQWKVPFNRQEMTSDFAAEMPERALTSDFTASGRDLGIALHNGYEKSPEGIEWAVGLFNGTGERPRQAITCVPGTLPTDPPVCTTGRPTTTPGDWEPTVAARVGYNMGGIKGYSDGDLEGGPFRLAVGASYRLRLGNFESDAQDHAIGVDLSLKSSGFALTGGLFLVKEGAGDFEVAFFVQPSYFLTPKQFQVVGRFAMIPEGDDNLLEIRGGFNWHFEGHAYKWVNDIGVLVETADGGEKQLQVRSQIQLVI
jgi:phosphate-selective porin OprO and OprP